LQVNFEDFKEGFVIVLSDAIDGLTVSSGEEPVQGNNQEIYYSTLNQAEVILANPIVIFCLSSP
jgi:hypothetical protein